MNQSVLPPEGGDGDRGSVILGTTWTLTLTSVLFVCLRMYTRMKLVQRIWWDDWLVVIAIVSHDYGTMARSHGKVD